MFWGGASYNNVFLPFKRYIPPGRRPYTSSGQAAGIEAGAAPTLRAALFTAWRASTATGPAAGGKTAPPCALPLFEPRRTGDRQRFPLYRSSTLQAAADTERAWTSPGGGGDLHVSTGPGTAGRVGDPGADVHRPRATTPTCVHGTAISPGRPAARAARAAMSCTPTTATIIIPALCEVRHTARAGRSTRSFHQHESGHPTDSTVSTRPFRPVNAWSVTCTSPMCFSSLVHGLHQVGRRFDLRPVAAKTK